MSYPLLKGPKELLFQRENPDGYRNILTNVLPKMFDDFEKKYDGNAVVIPFPNLEVIFSDFAQDYIAERFASSGWKANFYNKDKTIHVMPA